MNCPICQHADSAVIRTEPGGHTIRRRRECCRCRHRWTTAETAVDRLERLEQIERALVPVAGLVKAG